MEQKDDDLKWCAWDLDGRTVTIAFDTEDQVLNFINTHPHRHRHKDPGGKQIEGIAIDSVQSEKNPQC